MYGLRIFSITCAKSAASSMRSIAAIALIAIVCGASSPAWCKPAASLWVADTDNDRVVELTPSDLNHSGTPAPIVLNSAAVSEPEGVAFDKSKNLWVISHQHDLVLEFTPTQLKNLGTVSNPTPTATIGSAFFSGIVGCTFDAHGNLWIINGDGEGVDELTRAQLNAGSNPNIAPATNVTSVASLDFPNFGVFDKSGNLWLSSEDNSTIAKFSASQLGSSGDKTPAVILKSEILFSQGQIVFDRKGDLWVANYSDGSNATLVAFSKNQLSASGMPAPKITLSGAALDGPWGLAFDHGGQLWIGDYLSGHISKFGMKQLKKGGSPTPPVVLTGVLSHSYQMTFGPVF